MKIDITTNKRYRRVFNIYGGGTGSLPLGPGTKVEILEITNEPRAVRYPVGRDQPMTITATIKLTAEVTAAPWHRRCHICEAFPPAPSTFDELWFIIENHDGDRLLFPEPEGTKAERDAYPVEGWTLVDGEMTCHDCKTALDDAKANLRAKKVAAKKLI